MKPGESVPNPSPRLGYVESVLARHSAEAELPETLAAGLAQEAARAVLFCGEAALLRRDGETATALVTAADVARAGAGEGLVLALGHVGEHPVFAAQAPKEAAERFADDPAFRVVDLRAVAVEGAVPAGEMGLLATAKSLLGWHGRHGFCANCGHATAPTRGAWRRDCAQCGTQHFPRVDPVVIMLVTRGDRCLLGRAPRFAPGVYSCLAGFLEPGETIEDAVRREVLEEAGIRVGAVRYLASQPWPFPSSLMIGCLGEALDEELVLDRAELEDGRWFSRDEVRRMLVREHPDGLATPPPMAIAHHLVKHFSEG